MLKTANKSLKKGKKGLKQESENWSREVDRGPADCNNQHFRGEKRSLCSVQQGRPRLK